MTQMALRHLGRHKDSLTHVTTSINPMADLGEGRRSRVFVTACEQLLGTFIERNNKECGFSCMAPRMLPTAS